MTNNIDDLKKKLEAEMASLESELSQVARINPDNLSDWEATPAERDVSQADDNIVADSISDYVDNNAIVNKLEPRYKDIKSALEKIDAGTFGKCEQCGVEIDEERLTANPAARMCRDHMN
ncbi:MAG: TraR/DksA family transcriptional regulator [Parcubacteria bacterium C7867-005]|nr:MAG: TraR/DksA family transcriptional regulator [Parcubacteria bacterium C7867-005]